MIERGITSQADLRRFLITGLVIPKFPDMLLFFKPEYACGIKPRRPCTRRKRGAFAV